VDWRLAEYLDRGETMATPDRFTCRVLHANGRPILKLPDRKKTPGVPSGWVEVLSNDQSFTMNFVKEFVNVVRTDRESDENVLTDMVRGWFGPDAGRPGTRYEVAFEPVGDRLKMEPVTLQTSATGAETWRHYMLDDRFEHLLLIWSAPPRVGTDVVRVDAGSHEGLLPGSKVAQAGFVKRPIAAIGFRGRAIDLPPRVANCEGAVQVS